MVVGCCSYTRPFSYTGNHGSVTKSYISSLKSVSWSRTRVAQPGVFVVVMCDCFIVR